MIREADDLPLEEQQAPKSLRIEAIRLKNGDLIDAHCNEEDDYVHYKEQTKL